MTSKSYNLNEIQQTFLTIFFLFSLNCAILDQSFVSSPSSDPDLIKTPAPPRITDYEEKENRSSMNFHSKSAMTENNDSGFISRVSNMKIDSHDGKSQTISQVGKFPYRTTSKTRLQLFSENATPSGKIPEMQQPQPALTPSVFQNDPIKNATVAVRRPFLDTRPPQISFMKSAASEEVKETPLKSSQDPFNFITPSTRPYPTVIRNNNSSIAKTAVDPNKKVIVYSTPRPAELITTQIKLSPLREASKSIADENLLVIKGVEYTIDSKVGSGGSSVVHQAKNRKTGEEVAIKIVKLDDDLEEGYLNETKLLARLQGNNYIIKLFDYYHQTDQKRLYMVMEKGECDFHRVLQSHRGEIPLYSLMKYWYQMLQAVGYIHENGVIHSDLKPANFLMVRGRLKLIDFGIASNISSDCTSIIKFTQAGTFNYISPEALTDTSTSESPVRRNGPKIRLSTRSDVWSLGCILYCLIYKKTPFQDIKSLPQKIAVIASPETVINYPKMPSYYPPILTEMLQRCLVSNPKKRASVAELLTFPFHLVIPIDDQQ